MKRGFDRLVRWSALSRHTQFIGTAGGLSSDFLALLSLPLSCPSGQPTLVANLSSCQAPMPVASCIRALVIITPGQTKRRDPFRTVRAECSTGPATGPKKRSSLERALRPPPRYRVQMGTKPAKVGRLGPRCAKVKCGAASTPHTDGRLRKKVFDPRREQSC